MLGGWKAMKSMKDIRYKSVFESFQGWVPTFSKMTQIGKYLEANSGGGVLKLLKMTQFRLVPRYQLVVVLKFFEKTKISVCLAVKYTLSGNPPPPASGGVLNWALFQPHFLILYKRLKR